MKQYKNALRRKVELEWQVNAKCFGQKKKKKNCMCDKILDGETS